MLDFLQDIVGGIIANSMSACGRFFRTRRGLAAVVGLTAMVALMVGLSSRGTFGRPELYAVRVVVLDPEGQPVDDAEVWTSVMNEPQTVRGGSEIEIPRTKVPSHGGVVVWARHPRGVGKAPVTLGNASIVSVTLELAPPPEAVLRGTVVSVTGHRVIGAKVSVIGGSPVTTDEEGNFELMAGAPKGTRVRLRVEHPKLGIKEQYCYAGEKALEVSLD